MPEGEKDSTITTGRQSAGPNRTPEPGGEGAPGPRAETGPARLDVPAANAGHLVWAEFHLREANARSTPTARQLAVSKSIAHGLIAIAENR